MATMVLVNPYRDAGRSYMRALRAFPECEVAALWSSREIYNTWRHATPSGIRQNIFYENGDIKLLCKELDPLAPMGFIGVDDQGAILADELQARFYPEACNVVELSEVRGDKFRYTTYLGEKGITRTRQELVETAKPLSIRPPLILKPINGAGNEGVFYVDSEVSLQRVLLVLEETSRPYMAQDYLEGEEYCVEICSFGDWHTCTTVMKYGRMHFVNQISPWRYDNDLVDPKLDPDLIDYCVDVVSALGVRMGVTWIQVKRIGREFNLIECNFRSQGHANYDALKATTGITFADLVVHFHLKRSIPHGIERVGYSKQGEFKKLCVNNRRPRFIRDVDFSEIKNLPSVVSYFRNPLVVPGFANETKCLKETIGMILMANRDSNQFFKDAVTVDKWQKTVEW